MLNQDPTILKVQQDQHQGRVQREQDFHNQLFSNHSIREVQVDRFYKVAISIKEAYKQILLANCRNMNIVEYGCGRGSQAFVLAQHDAKLVTGIDISSVAIQQATAQIKSSDNLTFRVMNAEKLDFSPESIDLICGTGILHHLDLDRAMNQIRQVLHPHGKAVFIEPLGHNVLINLYRYFTPAIRSDDERPLLKQDLLKFNQYFKTIEIQYYYFTTLAASVFVNSSNFTVLVKTLESIDRQLFKVPTLKWQAWQVLIKLSDPIK